MILQRQGPATPPWQFKGGRCVPPWCRGGSQRRFFFFFKGEDGRWRFPMLGRTWDFFFLNHHYWIIIIIIIIIVFFCIFCVFVHLATFACIEIFYILSVFFLGKAIRLFWPYSRQFEHLLQALSCTFMTLLWGWRFFWCIVILVFRFLN